MTLLTISAPHHPSLAQPRVHDAVVDLIAATGRLMRAIWNSAVSQPKAAMVALSAFEEAEQARAIADSFARSDPNFAQDLYAAADRHERAAMR
jgi:hypothetical protein